MKVTQDFHQLYELSLEKTAFCICANKGADQLRSNHADDHCLCFHYIDNAIPLLPKSKILTIFCGCTVQFVSDLRETLDRFSRDAAHIEKLKGAIWGWYKNHRVII